MSMIRSEWLKVLGVLAALHLASGTSAQVTGIKYYLATCGGQNCDTVCATFGFQCAKTGQSFPPSSALPIFESLGISCKTLVNATDYMFYHFEDHPNYVAESPNSPEWVGMCLGFKSIPSTIDCHTANNSFVRRLCPCYDPSATHPPTSSGPYLSTTTPTSKEITTTSATTEPATAKATQPPTSSGPNLSTTTPTSKEITTTSATEPSTMHPTTTPTTPTKITTTTPTTSESEVTSTDYTTAEEHSTGNDVGTVAHQQQIGARGEAERTALIVVAVIAVALVLCLLGLAFLMMWNRRQAREKRGTELSDSASRVKFHVEYHKNKYDAGVPDMMDGLTVQTDIDEENSYCEMKSADHSLHNAKETEVKSSAVEQSYENLNEKATENILYASIPEGTNIALVADNNNPTYDSLLYSGHGQ